VGRGLQAFYQQIAILYPAELNAPEIPIPTAHWSFLKLSFPRDEAEGGSLRFVGIRVGLSSSNQPNEPAAATDPAATDPATIDDDPKERLDGGGEQALALRIGTIRAEKDCLEWLLDLMKGDSQPTKKRDEYKAYAVHNFGVSDRGFLHCWADAKRETGNTNWGKPGRKSKQCIDTPI
jgi:hypothetical protein